MSGVIAAIGVGVSAAAALATHVQANKQAADARGAAGQAEAGATAAKNAAGTAQKATPANTSTMAATNGPATAGVNSGPASTLLTGSGGVPNSMLNLGGGSALGSNTLLGQ
jgi:hypothetical protein